MATPRNVSFFAPSGAIVRMGFGVSVAPPPTDGTVAPTITLEPFGVSVTEPTGATFTAAASGSPAPTLQWQRTTPPGSTFADIPGATSASYSTGATEDTADSGRQFRLVASNTSGTATSSAATLTVNAAGAAPPAPADFVARRSAAGVIAWQGMDSDAEVTPFARPRDVNFNAVPLYTEADPVVGRCLTMKFLGARLAADFLASGGNGPRPMVLDDASDWPVTFPYVVMASKVPDTGALQKTLFSVTARSGNTLTVTYVPYATSEFSSGVSFQDYLIGDAIGSECQNYVRPFSALAAADNGKGANDPAANGTLPVRSRIPGNALYVPQAPSSFGYGYCAHPDYVTDPRFAPWIPSAQGTGAGDSVARSSAIDTSDIYIQFRAWLDWSALIPGMQIGKLFGLQTDETSPQQIVMRIGPGEGSFEIPSTPNRPFSLDKFNFATYGSAGMTMAANAYNPTGSSYQPGSLEPRTGKSWAATAIHATSGLPSTGQDTPDGSSAWESKHGRWVTYQWRIRPGKNWHYSVPVKNSWSSATQTSLTLLNVPDEWPTTNIAFAVESTSSTFLAASRSGAVLSGIALTAGSHVTLTALDDRSIVKTPATPAGAAVLNTLLEVKFADFGDTQYTTLFSVSDHPIVYGSRGQYAQFFDASMPGFSAAVFWGYKNLELSVATPPLKTYVQKFAQLIISKDPIAVPSNQPALGFTLPFALPAVGAIGSLGGNVPDVFEPAGASMYHVRNVIGAWGSAAVSVVLTGGAVTDLLYWVMGGGHGDTGWDGVLVWRASTGQWEQALTPGRADPVPTSVFDLVNGEVTTPATPLRVASQHMYQHVEGLDSGEGAGPAMFNLRKFAIGQLAISIGQSHRFDWPSKTWKRIGNNTGNGGGDQSGGCSAYCKDTLRKRFVRIPSDNGQAWHWIDYTRPDADAVWVAGTQPFRTGLNWSNVETAVATYDPVRDLIICGARAHQPRAVRAGDIGSSTWGLLNLTGVSLPTSMLGCAWQYRASADQFVLVDTSTLPATGVFVLTPPAPGANPLTATWTVSRRSFTGSSQYVQYTSDKTDYNRFRYVPSLDALLVCPSHSAPMECWKL
jgi:hypothetical protein